MGGREGERERGDRPRQKGQFTFHENDFISKTKRKTSGEMVYVVPSRSVTRRKEERNDDGKGSERSRRKGARLGARERGRELERGEERRLESPREKRDKERAGEALATGFTPVKSPTLC